MMDKMWAKIKWGKTLQTAKICKFSNGRYGFETKQFDEFEKNINMPMFETEEEATNWITNNKEWEAVRNDEHKHRKNKRV